MLHKLLQTVFIFGLLLWASSSWAQQTACNISLSDYAFVIVDTKGNCLQTIPNTVLGNTYTHSFTYCQEGAFQIIPGGSTFNTAVMAHNGGDTCNTG
ncbi:hypothetical protein [Saprospira grandis]|uniref:hypothetical protein n=1 Tax=Saprospira grandis TaxID=1008 RepID=UPI0022DE8C12|nr:hypothetical protein [Saprospira grandis]WBM74961.1 hypothetical protein OP864_01730 [Saprospira grandis]